MSNRIIMSNRNFEYVGGDIWQLLDVDENGHEYTKISIEAPKGKIPYLLCIDKNVELHDIQILIEFIYNLVALP